MCYALNILWQLISDVCYGKLTAGRILCKPYVMYLFTKVTLMSLDMCRSEDNGEKGRCKKGRAKCDVRVGGETEGSLLFVSSTQDTLVHMGHGGQNHPQTGP